MWLIRGSSKVSPARQRKRLQLLLASLIAVTILMVALFARYQRQPAPLPELLIPDLDVRYPPHYHFSIYGTDKPVGVALSPDSEHLYVSESSGQRLVKVFDREGKPLGSFAPPNTSPGDRVPVYLDCDSQGRVFVTDRLQHAVIVFDRHGNYLDSLISPDMALSEFVAAHTGGQLVGAEFSYNLFNESVAVSAAGGSAEISPPRLLEPWSPLGVRITEDGQLVVTDVTREQNRVWRFDLPQDAILSGWARLNQAASAFGVSGWREGELMYPNAAQVDSQGRIYASDGNNGRVSVWDNSGSYLYQFGTSGDEEPLSLPRGIAIDRRDRLYVVDAVAHRVQVYDVAGESAELIFWFGGFGLKDGQFHYPNDIALDDTGRLYIADRENDRVQVWSY